MNAIEIEGLTKNYDDLKALDRINWKIKKGEFCALLGPNGAGKSTMIHCITGLAGITKGSIKVFGKDVVEDYRETRKMIGLSQQDIHMDPYFKIIDMLVFQAGYFGVPKKVALKRAENLLKKLKIWDKRDVNHRKLSGGMKRKVEIAKALMHNPEILILDEPSAGLDIQTRRDLWDVIRKLNKDGLTVILTTHYLEEAEALCDDITIIDKGKIIVRNSTEKLLKELSTKTIVATYEKKPKKFAKSKVSGNKLTVNVTKNDSEEEILRKISKAGKIVSIETKNPGLEEVFLELTK